MKLINCRDFNKSAGTIRNMYVSICDTYLEKMNRNQSLGLKQIQEKFDLSLEDIKRLIRTITLSSDGFLHTPEIGKYSMILRYLEYGGQEIKPIHLLSISKKVLYNYLLGKGG